MQKGDLATLAPGAHLPRTQVPGSAGVSGLRPKRIDAKRMQLKGWAVRTPAAYVNAVLQLSRHIKKSPDSLDEEELREYFLYLKNEKPVADSTFSIA
jgi:integrase-like protein